MLALEKAFPEARIQGCPFHFKRCLWSNAKQLAMDNTLIHKIHVKRCMALAYLPQEFKINGRLYVEAENKNDDKITELNDDFVNTWLKKEAYFSNKWSFHNISHKTNNAFEAWNSRFNQMCKPKPNLIVFLNAIFKDSNYYLFMMTKINI